MSHRLRQMYSKMRHTALLGSTGLPRNATCSVQLLLERNVPAITESLATALRLVVASIQLTQLGMRFCTA